MRLVEENFAAGGGGGMEKPTSPDNTNGAFTSEQEREKPVIFGGEYLRKRAHEAIVSLKNIHKEVENQHKMRTAIKNGRIVEGEYIILNPLTNKEEVFLPREFIERRKGFEIEAGQPEPTMADLVEEFTSRPINKFTGETQRQKQLLRRIQKEASILKNFCREKLPQMDFSSVGGLSQEIDFSTTKYIELIAIVEKAVRQENYSMENVKELFLKTPSSRMQLAIIELLPALFKGTKDSPLAQKLLEQVILNFATIKRSTSQNHYNYDMSLEQLRDSGEIWGGYQIDYDEGDPEYDILTTASIINLAKFGKETENSLINIFQEKKIENRKDVEENSNIDEDNNANMNENYLYEGSDIDKDGDLIDRELKDLAEPFYLYNSKILNILSKIGTEKSIAFAIDFIKNDEDSSFVYKEEVLALLNSINVTQASGKLLELLRDKDNSISKRAGKFLFSLEVGRIGISKEGVRYLEKMFDLKELNSSDFSAKRLTASGKIGIFDKEGTLQKYIQVDAGDLLSDENVIHPEILEFTIETLFFTKGNETTEEKERREKYLKEFKEEFFDFYDENFYKDTGVRFNNLELQEQGQFLMYYKKSSPEEREILTAFIKEHKETGLKTFLSIEQGGPEIGEKILTIGEKLDQRSADAIFTKYAELVDLANSMRKYIMKESEQSNPALAGEVAENILITGKALLVMFAEDEVSPEYVMRRLEKCQTKMIFNLNIFKNLKGKINIEEAKGISFDIVNTLKYGRFKDDIIKMATNSDYDKYRGNIALSDIIQMFELFDESYKTRPELKQILKKTFAETITDTKKESKLYIIKMNDVIIAFDRVTKIGNNKKQFGSCNVLSFVQKLSLGEAIFMETMNEEAPFSEIQATCDAFTPFSSIYIEKGGFQVEKIDTTSDPEGIPWFVIKKPIYTNEDSFFKEKDIINLANTSIYEKGSRIIKKFEQATIEKIETVKELLTRGYIITRYVINKKKDAEYLAFEKKE